MKYKKSCRFSDSFSNFEYENSMTVYNGEKCTIARARALKAAETRRRRQEEVKSGKTDLKRDVLSNLYDMCCSAKNIRMLKSIRAYARNGETQWGMHFRNFLSQHHAIRRELYKFTGIYDELNTMEKELKRILFRNTRNTLAYVERYGYKMQDLLETIEKFSDAINKSNATIHPVWKAHEIITGSSDGKRVGLKKIQSQMNSAINKIRKSIISIAKQSNNAYKELISY